MEIDTEHLARLLELLRKHGVTSFKHGDLELEITAQGIALPRDPEIVAASRASVREHAPDPRPANQYAHTSLWPTGRPPSFDDEC